MAAAAGSKTHTTGNIETNPKWSWLTLCASTVQKMVNLCTLIYSLESANETESSKQEAEVDEYRDDILRAAKDAGQDYIDRIT